MTSKNDFLDIRLFINDELINKIPLGYNLLTECTIISSIFIPTVESKYHKDSNYGYHEFYKPVSRIIIINEK